MKMKSVASATRWQHKHIAGKWRGEMAAAIGWISIGNGISHGGRGVTGMCGGRWRMPRMTRGSMNVCRLVVSRAARRRLGGGAHSASLGTVLSKAHNIACNNMK